MHVVLIHGSYHGPWCWERLSPLLEAAGHRVTAADMPIADPALGAAGYADAIIEQVDWSEAPVVVAHSMAGLVAPIVATKREVLRLVFLSAMLPVPGRSIAEQRASEPIDGLVPPTTAEWTDLGDGVWQVGPNTARELFFHDATPQVAAWATARLRPQAYRFMNEVTPLTAWPDVSVASIVCTDDRAVNPEWSRRAARERLGVEPVEIGGAHSPFMTRPGELAALLEPMLR
jgi:hypothetical protein